MDTDELEPVIKTKGIDFDTLSISELELYILDLEAEIIKCKKFIVSNIYLINILGYKFVDC